MMAPTLTFERLSSDADLEAILEIERASFSTPWTADMFRWELRNTDVSATWVARSEIGQVVAFCCVWLVIDELHINNIAVAPELRRQGVAEGLLGHVIADAVVHGATRATLEVRPSNRSARALYDRLGFREGGLRRNYYTNPTEDALILWRTLVPTPPDR